MWNEAEEVHQGQITQSFTGCVEGLDLDNIVLTVLIVTVTVVTVIFQMMKIRLREIHSFICQIFIENLLCIGHCARC